MNVVIVGEASRKEGSKNTDFKNCSILSIPDVKSNLDKRFTKDIMIKKNLDKLLDENIISKNWFNKFINKLHMCSNSEKYRLTVIKLEAKNKKFKLTKASIKKTDDYVNNIGIKILIIPALVVHYTGKEIKHENLPQPNIFSWFKKIAEISDDDMFATFNCGIGMVLVIDDENQDTFFNLIKKDDAFFKVGTLIKSDKPNYCIIN
jgi:hypothetical protein